MNALSWLYDTETTPQMTDRTRDYIQTQIQRYHAAGSQELKDDALWRVASAADLLDPNASRVDDTNRTYVVAWIRGFESTLSH